MNEQQNQNRGGSLENRPSKAKTVLMSILVISLITIIGTVSYAYFTATGEVRKQEATISTGTVTLTFADNDTGLSTELAFGESATKKFTMVNTGTADSKVKMSFNEVVNTYLEGSLTYTLSYSEDADGPYTEVVSKTNVPQSKTTAKKPLANSLTIPAGKTYYYSLVVTLNYMDDVNQDADLNAVFSTKFIVEDINAKSVTEKIIASSNGAQTTSFANAATTAEGVFEMEDDYGTSYYYRGAVENNYVKFAGFFWRIIRMNGDGSLRILYDGKQAYANGVNDEGRVALTGVAWNTTNYDDAKYIGYMYGGANGEASTSKDQVQTNQTDTNIKTKLDEWYVTNIESKGYGDAVADVIFCNDRQIETDLANSNGGKYNNYTSLGYGKNATLYKVASRNGKNVSNPTPTFKCPQQNDAFTVNDTQVGNGALTYPVGLITADEIVAAGSGKYQTTNNKYYLYKGFTYWSLSPYRMEYTGYANVFYVYDEGSLNDYSVNIEGTVVPVINLSAEYASTLVGEGTMISPYCQPSEAI